MATRVFVHIGAMKSATSYLQSLCQRNKGRLESQGLLWLPLGSHFESTNRLLQHRFPRPVKPKQWREAVARIRAHPGDALLSNEQLAAQPDDRIKRLVRALRPAEVFVVLTARDLARVIPSHWQTTLRNRSVVPWPVYADWICSDDPPEEGVEEAAKFWRRQEFDTVAARWGERVGLDHLTVVTVPPRGSPSELVGERFLSLLGIDVAGFKQPNMANPSLGAGSAELLRRLNETAQDMDIGDYRRIIRKGLVNQGLARTSASEARYGLSEQQHDWCAAKAKSIIAGVEGLGVRVVGELDDLMPVAQPSGKYIDPTEATDAELFDIALGALLHLSTAVTTLAPTTAPTATAGS